MRPGFFQPVEYSKERQLRRGGRCEGRLGTVSNRNIKNSRCGKRTQRLLLEKEENGVKKLDIFGQVV